jgi:hypothetical protein
MTDSLTSGWHAPTIQSSALVCLLSHEGRVIVLPWPALLVLERG